MGSKSDYLEAKVLDLIFGQTAIPAIGTVYIGLFTAAPSDSGGGTEVTIGSNAYARAAVTNNTANFTGATGTSPTTKTNANVINFATPTGNWGIITHFGIFDAATGGNLLYWGALSQSVSAGLANAVSIPSSALTITED